MVIEVFQGVFITLLVIVAFPDWLLRASTDRLSLGVFGHTIGNVTAIFLIESLFEIIHPFDDQWVCLPIQPNTFIKQQYLLDLIVILNVNHCGLSITADELPLLFFKLLFYLGQHQIK